MKKPEPFYFQKKTQRMITEILDHKKASGKNTNLPDLIHTAITLIYNLEKTKT